jgi:hypothetical protein
VACAQKRVARLTVNEQTTSTISTRCQEQFVDKVFRVDSLLLNVSPLLGRIIYHPSNRNTNRAMTFVLTCVRFRQLSNGLQLACGNSRGRISAGVLRSLGMTPGLTTFLQLAGCGDCARHLSY